MQKSHSGMLFHLIMVRFEVARVLEYLFSTLRKKRECHIFSKNATSAFEMQISSLTYQKVFPKKQTMLQGKTIHRKQFLSGEHFLLKRAPASHQISKKSN